MQLEGKLYYSSIATRGYKEYRKPSLYEEVTDFTKINVFGTHNLLQGGMRSTRKRTRGMLRLVLRHKGTVHPYFCAARLIIFCL